ncbi:hypothetical protein BBR43_05440 [Corynebacterium striatum]|nr:hypothetical protein BBR43_05440 [Corynebacterium striatum]
MPAEKRLMVHLNLARRGQLIGAFSVVAVLLLGGWCAYLGKTWIAGFLVGIDVVALAAVFVPVKEKSTKSNGST